jgi:hypothetical protein
LQISSVCGRKSIILFTSYITDCEHPPLPANGNVTFNLTAFGENATYTCNNGYQISGNTIRTCDNKGNWSGQIPNCILSGMFHILHKLLLYTINFEKSLINKNSFSNCLCSDQTLTRYPDNAFYPFQSKS